MDSQSIKTLFQAVKNDDLKTFKSLILSNSDLNLCFGRFPLLSVCYLYNSYNILNKYEKYMLGIKTYNEVTEYIEIYLKFKKYAKKSIRLFLNGEKVEPILMLAVIDEREKIAKYYDKLYKNDEILQKLEIIYKITNKEIVYANQNLFEAPSKKVAVKKPLGLILTALVMCLMLVFPIISITIISNSYGIGSRSNPIHIRNETEFITALNKGSRYYILDNDIYLTQNITVANFSGTLDGDNYTIYAGDSQTGAIFTNLSGSIENIKIEIEYENLQIRGNFSVIAHNLTGNIVNTEITGNINAVFETTSDTYLSLYVINNSGTISNCNLSVDVSASNSSNQNAYLTGFSGVNSGSIINCKTGNNLFTTETVDTATYAIENNGTISDSSSSVSLTQTSDKEWHPNTAGIAINNNGTISNTQNFGSVSSISNNELTSSSVNSSFALYASGVVVNNAGTISNTENSGLITGIAQTANIYVSGIVCLNTFSYEINGNQLSITSQGRIDNCKNLGTITGTSQRNDLESVYLYAGGIASVSLTTISNSTSSGKINCSSVSSIIYAGGIAGQGGYGNYSAYVERNISNSFSDCQIDVSSNVEVIVGGVVGYSYATNINGSGFVGNININSVIAEVGGIAGFAYLATISNSYSGASFSLVSGSESGSQEGNSQAEENQVYISMLVGLYLTNSTTIYVSNNLSVENVTYPALRYQQINIFGNYSEIVEVTASECNTTLFGSVEEMLEYVQSGGVN